MANITASTNINTVSYTAGEDLTIGNATTFVRLTIDAQNSADVAKIEGTLPGSIIGNTQNCEICIVNTSTTTPLVVKLSAMTKNIRLNGKPGKLKVRGAWISVGTGTGALNQTLSTSSIGGKDIDWPPFVQVETSAGSGEYVVMMNIHGNFQNSSSVTPPYYRTFADVGTTQAIGAFFEYDEKNRSIKFATSVGGWAPPSGANIRMPNIHFTVNAVPVAAAASCSQWNVSGATVDIDTAMWSDRFANSSSNTAYSISLVNTNLPTVNLANIRKNFYVRNSIVTFDAYRVSSATGFPGAPLGQDVDGLYVPTQAGQVTNFYLGPNAITKNLRSYFFGRNVAFVYGMTLQAMYPTDSSLKYCENIYATGSFQLTNALNVVIYQLHFSDRLVPVLNATIPTAAISITLGARNCIIQKIREWDGGAPPKGNLINTLGISSRGNAIHDVVFDGRSHTPAALRCNGAGRTWIANVTTTNIADFLIDNSPNMVAVSPNRASNIKGTYATSITTPVGGYSEMVLTSSATPAASINNNNVLNAPNIMSTYSSSSTGQLVLGTGLDGYTTIAGGVEGVDYYYYNGNLLPKTTAFDATVTSSHPFRGVTGMASATVTGTTTNTTYTFAFRPYDTVQAWPALVSLTTANIRTAFAAMTEYDSNSGFEMRVRMVCTLDGNTVAVNAIKLQSCTVDTAFAPFDVGFVEVSYLNTTAGAVVGMIDTTSGNILRSFAVAAGGQLNVDHPHNYDRGLSRPFRVVSRKPGYQERVIAGDIDHMGVVMPMGLQVAYATMDAAVAGVAVDAATSTITVTGSKTFDEVYQHCQWWAAQRWNIVYTLPMASDDGATFTVPLTHKISWAMPSTKTLEGGWLQLAATGTHTYKLSGTKIEFKTAGTYNMSASTFSGTCELVNTSGGAVTVSVSGSPSFTNTGPSITVTAPAVALTVTGFPTGSDVVILAAGTTTVRDSVDSVVGTSWAYNYAITEAIDIGVILPGYVPYYVRNYSLTGASATLPVTLTPDRNYT